MDSVVDAQTVRGHGHVIAVHLQTCFKVYRSADVATNPYEESAGGSHANPASLHVCSNRVHLAATRLLLSRDTPLL